MKQYEGRKMQLYHVIPCHVIPCDIVLYQVIWISSVGWHSVEFKGWWTGPKRRGWEWWSTLTPSVECHGAKWQVFSRDAKGLPLHNSVHNPSQMEQLLPELTWIYSHFMWVVFRVAEWSFCHAYECTRFNHIWCGHMPVTWMCVGSSWTNTFWLWPILVYLTSAYFAIHCLIFQRFISLILREVCLCPGYVLSIQW